VDRELLNFIVCSVCESPLIYKEDVLVCEKCGKTIKIEDGIPVFSEDDFDPETSEKFGFSWSKFPDIYKKEKEDFLNWIYPVKENFFKEKIVLDAGCGNGLHAKMSSEFGAKVVFGIDLSKAVKEAKRNVADRKNVHILQGNIYSLPFLPETFDYVYSIGVIQHLPYREKAIKELYKRVKKGGALSLWVYGYEGTFWVRVLIEPIRKFLRIFSPKIIYVLSFLPAVGFWITNKFFYFLCKISNKLCKIFPLSEYFSYMSNFPFKYQFNTVFDQLVAPRSYFFKKEELEKIFEGLKFKNVVITSRNGMSWRVFANGKDE